MNKNAQKTILSIVDLSCDKFGSLELLLINLSQKLNEHNFKSVIVFNKEVPKQFRDKFTGITIDSISKSEGQLNFYYQLAKIIFKYKPNIVHFGFYPLFSPVSVVASICGCNNVIITDHLSGEAPKHHGIKKRIVFLRNKFISLFIKKIICVSDYVLNRNKLIPGIDQSKLSRHYLGVSLERFHPHAHKESILQELNIPPGTFIISSVAHLIKEKGIEDLIRAARLIIDKHENVLFLIAGTGREEKELKDLANELGIDKQVMFLGLRNDSEKIYSISDVFVCPSVWQEAFGLTNIEAMACGAPVIATKVGGIPEIIEDNITGLLIERNDPQALAHAIERLYNDPNLRMQLIERSLKSIRQRFDLERTINESIAIYRHYI